MRLDEDDLRELEALLRERSRIALPLCTLLLAFNALDWVVYPDLALRWLAYRASVLALVLVVVPLISNLRGRYAFVVPQVYALCLAFPISLMTFETGGFASGYYVGLIVVLSGVLVVFPVNATRGMQSAAWILLPYLGLGLLHGGVSSAGAAPSLVFLGTVSFFLVLGSHLATVVFVEQRRTERRMAALMASLEESSRRDPLTQVFNRRHLSERLDQAFARFEDAGQRFSFLIADVDHFKQLNDGHGHQAGDYALVKVAEAMRRRVRTEDVIFRYGGEEFAVLLEGASLEQACHAAERLRGTISALQIGWHGAQLTLTVSIGVSEVRPGDDADAIIRRADTALYEAKAAGRDRVQAD